MGMCSPTDSAVATVTVFSSNTGLDPDSGEIEDKIRVKKEWNKGERRENMSEERCCSGVRGGS